MLYICATPIGNLEDISLRALQHLTNADIILCEDTRTSHKLLSYHGIKPKRLVALHEHNENEVSAKVREWLTEGLTIVQTSDAGTPGISDPGARLCNQLYQHGLTPHPLPGACAYVSLLSVAGLVNGTSLFYGFLPAKSSARQKQLATWGTVDYAVAIYEAPHRIIACLEDIITVLGPEREVVMGRELTKQFETIRKTTVTELLNFITADSNQQRGEFVLLILPAAVTNEVVLTPKQIHTLTLLARELPAKKAIKLTQQLVGGDADIMYDYLITHKSTSNQ